jgi:putative ATPase
MLDAGEDRLFIARRLVRAAVEDIGLADPQALVVANAAKDAFDFLGSPEGELALAQATIYLATAPKSNAAYNAYKAATRVAKEHGSLMPPKTILNAPTKLMKEIGYGDSYRYDHDEPDAFSGQDYWPEKLGPQNFYEPATAASSARCASGSIGGRSCAGSGGVSNRTTSWPGSSRPSTPLLRPKSRGCPEQVRA